MWPTYFLLGLKLLVQRSLYKEALLVSSFVLYVNWSVVVVFFWGGGDWHTARLQYTQ